MYTIVTEQIMQINSRTKQVNNTDSKNTNTANAPSSCKKLTYSKSGQLQTIIVGALPSIQVMGNRTMSRAGTSASLLR